MNVYLICSALWVQITHITVSFMTKDCAIKFLGEKYLIIQKSVATPTLCFEGINVVLQFLVMFIIKNNCFQAFLQLFAKLFRIATFSQHKNYGLRQSLIKKFQHVLTKQQYILYKLSYCHLPLWLDQVFGFCYKSNGLVTTSQDTAPSGLKMFNKLYYILMYRHECNCPLFPLHQEN